MPINQQGKYVNPIWNNNAPPAIDATELNAISETLEKLDAGGGSGGGDGKRYARFVIGTSTNGWTEADCDYLCDGTADQDTFLEAINALPSNGGEIKVLEGTYNFSGAIQIYPNSDTYHISIVGSGVNTRLNIAGNDVYYYNYGDNKSTEFYFSNISISGINARGVGTGRFSFSQTYLENPVLGSGSYESILLYNNEIRITQDDVVVSPGSIDGFSEIIGNRIFINGSVTPIIASATDDNLNFSNNYVYADTQGVTIGVSSLGSFSGNSTYNCNITVYGAASGNSVSGGDITILGNGSATGNKVSDGYISGADGCSICGNTVSVSDSADAGIIIYKSAFEQHEPLVPKTISGNTVLGGKCGILLRSPSSGLSDRDVGNVVISGNSCSSDTPLQIASEWHDCLITGNMFPNGTIVDNGTNNTKANNFTGT